MEIERNKSRSNSIKVVDLTHFVAGPYCTKLLADCGADVVKVENPRGGDPARSIGPFLKDKPGMERSGLFLHLNTNKRGITLNLKSQAGKKILRELVKDADILVESFSPRVMPGLGLSYQDLEKINPRLVMTSISNFGQTGPYRDYKASELTLYGMGGSMDVTGVPEREPLKLAGNLAQYYAGVIAAVATMGALFASERNGKGQHIDASIMETLLFSQDRRAPYLLSYQYVGEVQPRVGPTTARVPEGVYPCKDGYWDIFGGSMWWPRIFQMLGRPEELADPKYGTTAGQLDPVNQAEILGVVLPWAMERTRSEIWEAGMAARTVCSPVYTVEDTAKDYHLKERGFWAEIEHPVAGKLTYPGSPLRPSKMHWGAKQPAPLLGQHNEEIYTQLGYSKLNLVKLKEQGVI